MCYEQVCCFLVAMSLAKYLLTLFVVSFFAPTDEVLGASEQQTLLVQMTGTCKECKDWQLWV